jgi:integrase
MEHTGLAWNPHLFRHLSAKLILDDNPGAYEIVRRVLGHRSIETTTSFYCGHEAAAAARHYDEVILKLRRKQVRS